MALFPVYVGCDFREEKRDKRLKVEGKGILLGIVVVGRGVSHEPSLLVAGSDLI